MSTKTDDLTIMDLYSPAGTKVRFSFPTHGHDSDKELAKKHLTQGEIYTVEYTEVEDSSSDVVLSEFPRIRFNTVLFSDARPKCPHCGQHMDKEES